MFLHKQLGAGLKNKRPTVGTERLHCYELPPLRDCRRLFAEKLGQPVDWGVADGRTRSGSTTPTFTAGLRRTLRR